MLTVTPDSGAPQLTARIPPFTMCIAPLTAMEYITAAEVLPLAVSFATAVKVTVQIGKRRAAVDGADSAIHNVHRSIDGDGIHNRGGGVAARGVLRDGCEGDCSDRKAARRS